MSVAFSPVWITPDGPLPPASEGDTVAVSLLVDSVATVTLVAGQDSIDVGTSSVVRLRINGADIAFTQTGTSISFAPVTFACVATVSRRSVPTFSLHEGLLPPGISLLRSGTISGRVANVPSVTPVTYEFTIRLTESGKVRDRRFSITASPVPTPLVWDITGLPDPVFAGGEFFHRPLGTVMRGGAFGATFALGGGDGTGPVPLTVSSPAVPVGFIAGLPRGLRLVPGGTRIEGVVSISATPGVYVFAINAVSAQAPAPLICSVTVPSDLAGSVAPPVVVAWSTASGRLGLLREAEPCPYSVRATVIGGGQPISYLLVEGSLPPGLHLDGDTGDIVGITGFIDADASFRFVVRARAGATFVDRAFSIRVLSRYASRKVFNISLPAPRDAVMASSVYRTLIPSNSIFRADDPGYGLPTRPNIYIVGGLNATASLLDSAVSGEGTPYIPNPDYHSDFELWLGPHRLVTVRGTDGRALYEVLLRTMIDPAEGAGGFALGGTVPVDQRVLYQQDARRQNPRYVYENSVRNARLDLIKDVGIDAADPAFAQTVGPTGAECMPQWMLAEGAYSLAMPVAYLRPGTGAAALAACQAAVGRTLPPNGRIIRSVGYLVETVELITTTFDDDLSFIPFPLNASQPSVNIGGWGAGLKLVLLSVDGEEPTIMSASDYTLGVDGLMTFMPTGSNAVLIIAVSGTAPTTPARNVTATTSTLRIGPLVSSFTGVTVNRVANSDYRVSSDSIEFNEPLSANSEVILKTAPTAFDGQDVFDAEMRVAGKYLKLSETGGT